MKGIAHASHFLDVQRSKQQVIRQDFLQLFQLSVNRIIENRELNTLDMTMGASVIASKLVALTLCSQNSELR